MQKKIYDVGVSNVTLEEVMDEYLKDRKDKSETVYFTVQGLKKELEKYLKLPLYKISQTTAREMADIVQSRGSAKNTIYRFMLILKAVFNYAVKAEHITKSPFINITTKQEEVERKYLSIDQMHKLWDEKDSYTFYRLVIYMFLFSCLTGLRFSDMLTLTWGQVRAIPGGYYRLTFTQKKTKKLEYLDINAQAYSLLIDIQKDADTSTKVFPVNRSVENLQRKIRAATNKILGEEFTFHCARHTFATTMLSNGADLYTVSKLLGHKYINTTEIYAKVVDKNKQAAIDLLPKL